MHPPRPKSEHFLIATSPTRLCLMRGYFSARPPPPPQPGNFFIERMIHWQRVPETHLRFARLGSGRTGPQPPCLTVLNTWKETKRSHASGTCDTNCFGGRCLSMKSWVSSGFKILTERTVPFLQLAPEKAAWVICPTWKIQFFVSAVMRPNKNVKGSVHLGLECTWQKDF